MAVVAEFVIVPDHDHGKPLVQTLQIRIGPITAIQMPVVLEIGRHGLARRQGCQLAGAAFLKAGVHGLVDIVAQVHDIIDVFLGQACQGVVVAKAVVLTGDIAQPQALDVLVGAGQRLEAPRAAGHAAMDEPIVVGRKFTQRRMGDR